MIRRTAALLLTLGWPAGGCGGDAKPKAAAGSEARTGPQAEAEALGREVFELVDRAVDYRGSHRGRPAGSLRQMGVDSLTSETARVLVNVERQPLVTVRYRRTEGREITGCRGDSHVLEEASLNSGRFTLMCTDRAGDQRPMKVGGSSE